MKIVHLSPSIYPHSIGGLEKYVYHLGNELSKMHHDVTFLTTIKHKKSNNIIHVKNIVDAFKLLLGKKYEILHIHSYGDRPLGIFFNELLILWSKFLCGMKVVITPHAAIDALYRNSTTGKGFFRKIALRFYMLIMSLFFRLFVDNIIALTPQQKILFEKIGFPSKKISIIPNAIPEKLFSSPFKGKKLTSSPIVILHVGRVNPQKDIMTLVEAFSKLRREHKDVVLIFAGPDNGTYADNLKTCVKKSGLEDSVNFLGLISEKRLLDLYRQAYVLVLSSLYEGFPTVLLEAAALGCPVITADSFDAGFLADYILLFSKGDSEELLSTLRFALSNHEVLENNANGAYTAVLNYRWSHVAKEIGDLYCNLISGHCQHCGSCFDKKANLF